MRDEAIWPHSVEQYLVLRQADKFSFFEPDSGGYGFGSTILLQPRNLHFFSCFIFPPFVELCWPGNCDTVLLASMPH